MDIYIYSEFDSIAATRGGANEGGAQARRLLSELLILLSSQPRKEKEKEVDNKVDESHSSSSSSHEEEDNDSNVSSNTGVKKQKIESLSDTFDSLGCGLVVMAATNRIDVSSVSACNHMIIRLILSFP